MNNQTACVWKTVCGVTSVYNQLGQKLSFYDIRGNKGEYKYDAHDRLKYSVVTTDGVTTRTEFCYSKRGKVKQMFIESSDGWIVYKRFNRKERLKWHYGINRKTGETLECGKRPRAARGWVR